MNSETPRFTALSHIGLLQVQGPDANKFLQGQVTNDVNACTQQKWQHNAHCTPKGRMIANFDNARIDDQTLLFRLPADTLSALKTSLSKYIVFSKAKLTDVSEQYRSIGIQGTNVIAWVEQQLGVEFPAESTVALSTQNQQPALNQQSAQGQQEEQTQAVFLKLDEQRIECWFPADVPLPTALAGIEIADDLTPWLLRDIELGRGWVKEATVDEFLPQFLNLQTEAIAGINFKKGCYTGQEIVARMHYKGKLKRHMYRFELDSADETPGAGVNLYTEGSSQATGTVVNSVQLNNKVQLLAVATEESASAGTLTLEQGNPKTLNLLPLPYTVD